MSREKSGGVVIVVRGQCWPKFFVEVFVQVIYHIPVQRDTRGCVICHGLEPQLPCSRLSMSYNGCADESVPYIITFCRGFDDAFFESFVTSQQCATQL